MVSSKTDLFKNLAWEEWLPIKNKIENFFNVDMPSIPPLPEKISGWQRWYPKHNRWMSILSADINQVVCLDFEAEKQSDGTWLPSLCICFDGTWIVGYPDREGAKTFNFPCDRVVITQNGVAYDRRYLSSNYILEDKTYHLDIMQLNTLMAGLAEGNDSPLRSMWLTFKRKQEEGQNVPYWYAQGCPNSLKDMTEHYLGAEWAKKIDKSIREAYEKNPAAISAATLFEYCCTDVLVTWHLAKVLYKRASAIFINHPATWLGMGDVNRSRYYLKDWDKFLETSEYEYLKVKNKLEIVVRYLIENAKPEDYPEFDWHTLTRGKNKGIPFWQTKIDFSTAAIFRSNLEVQLLKLTWNDFPIDLKKVGRQSVWMAGGVPLLHPSGKLEDNLGTPLCKDYITYAENGTLRSPVLEHLPDNVKVTLPELFNLLGSISQWIAYRSRYQELYLKNISEDTSICISDFNGTGTVSRRATSKVWVVLPKPKALKIGSNVMNYIVAPKGYKFVSADFVSQESRIAAAQMTDCKHGKHLSTPWSASIMQGDKSQGTDAHSQTAKRIGISRDRAKTVNFCVQYGGGLAQTSTTVRLAKGCSTTEADRLASDFLQWLKGRDGVAASMFKSLNTLSNISGVRTYLLGVKMPDTLDAGHLYNSDAFKTTRDNWHIQSAGQDELHALIFIVKYLAKKANIECYFACAVHDRAAFFTLESQAETLAQILDQAYEKLMELSYEAAAEFWDTYCPKGKLKRPILEPLDNWRKFEKVVISDCFME